MATFKGDIGNDDYELFSKIKYKLTNLKIKLNNFFVLGNVSLVDLRPLL